MGLLRQPLTMKRHDKNTTEGGEEKRWERRKREEERGISADVVWCPTES